MQILTGGGGSVPPANLGVPLDLAAAAAPALTSSSTTATRRLLAVTEAQQAARDAHTRMRGLVQSAQQALLQGLIVGESATAGTSGIVAVAADVDAAALRGGGSASYALGSSGAIVSLASSFVAPLSPGSTNVQLLLAHQADTAQLLASGFPSAASVPARRRLLASEPQVAGAASTTVVSSQVSMASSGGAANVVLPLNSAYVPSQVRRALTVCCG